MKKFFKFCGSMVLILTLAGLVFACIGFLTGGPQAVSNMVSNLTNGKVNVSWSGVQVDLNGFNIDWGNMFNDNVRYDINDQANFDKDYPIWEKDVKKTKIEGADAGTIEAMNLELGGCEFLLETSEDKAFYFEYKGTGKSQAYVKGNELYVKVLSMVEWSIGDNRNTVILYVPKEVVLGNVAVSLGAGEMELDGLKATQMDFELGAGQVHATGLETEQMEVSVGAGDIKFTDAVLKDVKVEVGAGNVALEGAVSGNISAVCAMGNITLELDGAETDFDYDIECVTGNITVGNHEYSGLAQEQSIDNHAEKSIELECAMGNVEVKFK